MRRPHLVWSLVLALLTLAGCGGAGRPGAALPYVPATSGFGPAPRTPDGPLAPPVRAAVDRLARSLADGRLDGKAVRQIAASGDPRLGWVLSDALRLVFEGVDAQRLTGAFAQLTGTRSASREAGNPWQRVTDRLIAWDLPAPPDYRRIKAAMLLPVEPGWKPFFDDAEAKIDWRLLSWGGVRIDARPLDSREACPDGCIPALDDPPLTGVDGGAWLADGRDVFGVEAGGQALALPQNIMEVHELVNVTLGGVRLGIPYCTLCGSAQAYETALASGRVTLRTSGLLSRSNKVMYDLTTRSAFDTFTGEAVSGPLREAGVTLRQRTVVRTTWGAWKRAHPATRLIARDGGLGRTYPLHPLRGRDAGGPIFPVGDVDPRLPVQARVVGVGSGRGAVAFPVAAAQRALHAGRAVYARGVTLSLDGGGLRARRGGHDAPAHEAFWFAWSQFQAGTAVWRDVPRARR